MPGFIVDGIGSGAPGNNIETYYTYTWDIQSIFGGSTSKPPLIYLKEMGLPTFSVGQERVKGTSLNYKYASDITWEDVKVTWYDTKGMLAVIKDWRKSVWTEETGIQPPNQYKKESWLRTFLPDASEINGWKLINSWPSSIRHGDLTYAQSDIKVVDVTISYDWAEEIAE